ncbi:acyl-CoA dehydrogenase [Mycobacterium paraintracellulare]|uniref:acyl-CoA dehydrogenase n=1 Tax=Mycobacterium paraintracellulare TaxID=1138383 RepID=UPI0019286498|nr:acyl-CoA dehydrogenase [Mycobacterium paraintracellulare]BCP14156.1 acyl-CoA dehydrogenase FadE22 [Mycobacterium paraintracellulare]
MGIALTEEHRELSGVVRAFLDRRGARGAARALLEAPVEPRPDMWEELADMGWLGIHISEEFGGSGYGLEELVVVAEEFGRAVAPGPFLPTVITSAIVATRGDADTKARLLPGLVDGTTVAATGFGGNLSFNGREVSGDAGIVLGAGLADILALRVGDDVVIVEAQAPGVNVQQVASFDATRRSGTVTLADVTSPSATVLPGAARVARALARVLVSAEAVGAAEDCLDTALAYAKVREQFGRTIGTFQAVKHHLANMLVAAEAAAAVVWDAARACAGDERELELIAACAATLAIPAYIGNAELNVHLHGGIGFTWEHDAHLHLRRAITLRALFGGSASATDVYDFSAGGVRRRNWIELPDHAEQLREHVRSDIDGWAGLPPDELRMTMLETGYLVPHWPKPWGRGADAVEQLVIEEELSTAKVKRPDLSVTGWVTLTLIQCGSPEQIDRFVEPALRGEHVWCQLFSEPGAGSDAAAVSTKATRVEGGWRVTGQKVWTSLAHECHMGLATVRTNPDARKHAGVTTVIIDMSADGVEVRPLRQITGGAEFSEVFLTDVFVPDSNVVGEVDKGWAVARATLGNERVTIGGGGDEGDTDSLIELVERYGHQVAGVKERAGRCIADGHAVRLLNLRRAARSVTGAGPGPEGNVTKLLLAGHVGVRNSLVSELYGPLTALACGDGADAGVVELGSRAYAIAGGTSEITRNQIAERILGLPRDPLVS